MKLLRIKSFYAKHASDFFDALFLFVLVFVSVVRFSALDYPTNNEVYRDYLISHHVVAYGEHPTTGPHNTVFPSIRNSPVYFYVGAGVLFVHDHILSLTVFNILLQAAGLLFLYLLGKRLFHPGVAWVAVVLYAVSWFSYRQAFEFWQPYVMYPFVVASLWLFVCGYQEKRFRDLWLAVVAVTIGGIFHYSSFALLLIYGAALLYILPKWKSGWTRYAQMALTVILMVGAAYASVFWFAYHNPNLLSHGVSGQSSFINSLSVFGTNLWRNLRQMVSVFFVPFTRFQWIRYIGGTVAGASIVYYCLTAPRTRRNWALIMVGAILVPVVLASLFTSIPFDYYYSPVFSLLFLLMSASVFYTFGSSRILLAFRWVLIAGLIILFSADGYFIKTPPAKASHAAQRQAIANSLEEVVSPNQANFQFWVYQKGNPYRGQDAFFWDLLEKRWNKQLVHVVDYSNGYLSNNTNEYHLFVCQDFGDLELDTCRQFYMDKNPGYVILEEIYHAYPYVIYETKWQP